MSSPSSLPLRVAVIGSGPAGFYSAGALLDREDFDVRVDLIESLPAPFGLLRYGVAPDHQKAKAVARIFERTADHPRFRYLGNVHFGQDLHRADLEAHYHAIVHATGASEDRRLEIEGEDLPGSEAAGRFVGWYNSLPSHRRERFDLSSESVMVIGNGNVALDLARILAHGVDTLRQSDISELALESLAASRIRDIHVVGRRGPAQAAFTLPALREMGELEGADILCDPAEAEPDEATRRSLSERPDREAEGKLAIFREFAGRRPSGKPRRIHFRFLASPIELAGAGRVEEVRLERNLQSPAKDGALRAEPTGELESIPAGLVFRAIGYRGLPTPGLPFDSRRSLLPHSIGRVIDPERGEAVTGHYCSGWRKRGASGGIGSNRPCVQETVEALLEDAAAGRLLAPKDPDPLAIERILQEQGIRPVSFEDWRRIDRLEVEAGARLGRPRVKLDRVEEMLSLLEPA